MKPMMVMNRLMELMLSNPTSDPIRASAEGGPQGTFENILCGRPTARLHSKSWHNTDMIITDYQDVGDAVSALTMYVKERTWDSTLTEEIVTFIGMHCSRMFYLKI